MDDGLSSFIPVSLNLSSIEADHSDDEEAEAAEELKRDKQIEEDLKNASFGDLIDEEDEEEEDDSQVSGGESIISENHCDTNAFSSERSKEQSLSSLKNGNNSSYSFTHNSNSHNDYNGISGNVDNNSGLTYASNSAKHELGNNDCKETSNDYVSNYPLQCRVKSLNSKSFQSHSPQEQRPANFPKDMNNHSQEKSTEYVQNHSDHPTALYEDYRKKQFFYNSQVSELEQQRRKEIHATENFRHEIKSLKQRLTLVEGEKDKLTSSLQEFQNLITDFRSENIMLKGKLAALELQLSAEKEAKVSAQNKFESAEVTIQTLEQQINGLARSETAVRLQSQSDSIIKDVKLRHQKEVQQLKENIDKLQKCLSSKNDECENLNDKVSQLQQKCEEIRITKGEIINKLSDNLEASQRQCRKLLESDMISKVSMMKLQLQHVEEEKKKLEKENTSLKDELRSLENELQAAEALKNFKNDNEEDSKDDNQTNQKGDSGKKLSGMKHELQKLLKKIQTYRHQNNSLKEKLNELQRQLPFWEEKAKLFEFRCKESEKKVQQLEKQLDEVSPGESIPKMLHEKELNVLKNELMDLQKKYNDILERFKSSSSNEKNVLEANMNLKNKITDMLKSHASDKLKAVGECREKYLKLRDSAVKKLSDELSAKADKELETVHRNYENRISELEKEVIRLNDNLYDTKAEYLTMLEEKKDLQSKIYSISKSKEYQDIERGIREEYEKKLNEIKGFQKLTKDRFAASVENKVEKLQEEWTKQKLKEVTEFVESTKQRLDEEFKKCLDKEQSKFQCEKEKLTHEYEEKIKDLKQQSEIDKNASDEKLRECFELKWKNEVKELQQNHQQELELIRLNYERKMLKLENEIENLKDDLSKRSGDNLELQSLQRQLSVEKQAWKEEKSDLISKFDSLSEKLRTYVEKERVLREKVKYSKRLKTEFQGKIDQLITKNTELENQNALQENQLSELNEKHRKDVHSLQQNLKKHSVSKSVESQTEELLVPRLTYLNARNMFIECLRKISGEINTYIINSRKRTADHLKGALCRYHDQIISKIWQDVLIDNSCLSSIILPHFSANSHSTISSYDNISPGTIQQEFNTRLSDFTPVDKLAPGDTGKRINSCQSEVTIPKTFQNEKESYSGVRFEDMSFDFVPDSDFMSTKMPDYLRPGGLFNLKDVNTKFSYPQRISPITKINKQ